MDAALSPREIQSRVRAGQTVAEIAQTSGMAESAIDPFAGTVLAERAFVAAQATRGQVRRAGVSIHQTLAELVGDRLASRGLNSSDVAWDAWRGADRLWTLRASYHSGSALHEGVFRYDATGRFSVPVNDEARWLIGEQSPARGPRPGRRNPNRDTDAEPTVDLRGSREPTLMDFEPDDYSPAHLTEVDGIYDLVQESPGMDVLYDMLASFNEDSVRIYEGLKVARRVDVEGSEPTAPLADQPRPPKKDEAKEPTQRIPKSKKRAVVPTWDEIMFGSPQGQP
jgi:hypothetical protein